MGHADPDDRLSRIATHWSAVIAAHAGPSEAAEAVRNRLLLRYTGPVYRYLLGAVRDADTAADLCQEFAVRFLRGDFRRAAPDRGRFRAYVKSALVNLVNDYHRARQARPQPLEADPAAPRLSSDDEFAGAWQQSLLDQTWAALREANPVFHGVLLLRVAEPGLASAEMAERLSLQLGKPMTAENVRKTLQRAHVKFAELLLDQVGASLDEPTAAGLEAELKTLDLLKYCRSALDRRRARAG